MFESCVIQKVCEKLSLKQLFLHFSQPFWNPVNKGKQKKKTVSHFVIDPCIGEVSEEAGQFWWKPSQHVGLYAEPLFSSCSLPNQRLIVNTILVKSRSYVRVLAMREAEFPGFYLEDAGL